MARLEAHHLKYRFSTLYARANFPLYPLLALQTVLGAIHLLNILGVSYLHHVAQRPSNIVTFSLEMDLTPLIFVLSTVTFALILKRGETQACIYSAFSGILVGLVWGIDLSASVFALLLPAAALLSLRGVEEYISWFIALMTGFEILVLSHWAFFTPLGLISPARPLAELELALFSLQAPLSPLIALLVIFMWLLKPLLKAASGNLSRRFGRGARQLKKREFSYPTFLPRVLLTSALILAVSAAIYPYAPAINPEGRPVGVDFYNYIELMDEVDSDLSSAFRVVDGSRPVLLLLIYGLKSIFHLSTFDAVKYFPAFLNPLLTLTVYFMVHQAADDRGAAGLASLFTALGSSLTVGLYSYFLANMLALSFTYASLSFFFKAWKEERPVFLIPSLALASLAVFTHPWMVIHYLTAMVLTMSILCAKFIVIGMYKRELVLTSTYIAVTGLVFLLKTSMFGGIRSLSAAFGAGSQLPCAAEFWGNVMFGFSYLYGGALSNPLLLGLAAIGVYILGVGTLPRTFFYALLASSSLYYLVSDGMMMSRIIYNIPFCAFAGLGALYMLKNFQIKDRTKTVLSAYAVSNLLVYLFRSLATFV